eukprot:CAMPEP_0184481012 /NCGR_PEP_ID=MMETSP0113_2-20130426/2564_1 /TAXON_ID=91329 /ORGANISM="Norrisiella sphaerica, Strain BC52" /LENGTH=332 /DNA_ID=CAMNT_0026859885 /DNA_START=240 /DNA_END=1238 /DNA_ORIENTATION=-
MISNKLDWLGHYTEIIPDSFAFDGIQYQPKSATVSGLLILRLLEQKGQEFVDQEISRALSASVEPYSSMTVSIQPKERLAAERRNVYCSVTAQLARWVTGKISLEVDPRLANDANLVVQEVRELAKILKTYDVDAKSKILFKIPGTWEGILAAKMITLQEEYMCQVTHVYSMAQATAAADAKVAVVQPYVGRVNDWYHKNPDKLSEDNDGLGDNEGVRLVSKVYNFIKKYDLPTRVMAASIRNTKDAIALSGVDYMVLSPKLIKDLAMTPGTFEPPKLTPKSAEMANFTPQEIRGQELSEAAESLLQDSLKASSETIEKVEDILANTAIGNL